MGYKTKSRNTWGCLLIAPIGAATALMGGCVEAGASHSHATLRGAKTTMPITFRLSSYKSHWLVGEAVQVDLIFENHSRKMVHVPDLEDPHNWQPTFTVSGPGFVPPRHFNTCFPRFLPEPADQTYRNLRLTGIKPGQTYERSPSIGKVVDLSRPGAYTLSASTPTSLGVVQAAPFTFTVEAPTRASTSGLEMQADLPNYLHLRTRWIVSSARKTQVMRASINSRHDDAGVPHFEQGDGLAIATVGADAQEPFAPWTDLTVLGDEQVANWTGWRDESSLYATQGLDNAEYPKLQLPVYPLLRLPLPGDSRLVPHALMSAGQALDVFALSADGRTLQMARFPRAEPQLSHPTTVHPAWAWSHPLSAPAASATAALAPAHAGSARHIVWTSQQGDALLLGHVLAPAGGQPPADAPPVTLPHAHALPGCRPAVRVDAAGLTHAAVLYASDPGLRQISLAELTYGAGGQPMGPPKVTPQGALPEDPTAAALAYPFIGSEGVRPEWVVALQSGMIVHDGAPHARLRLPFPLALPLELVPLGDRAYILTADPGTAAGPSLTRLD